MSVDDRLRMGLAANASALAEPEVELILGNALAAHRRHRALRWTGIAGAAAVTCAALLLPAGWHADPPPGPPAGKAPVSVEGRYAGLVAPLPGAPEAAGRWALDLGAEGQLVATAPNRFGKGVPEVVGGSEGRYLRTEAFDDGLCRELGPGRYTVTRGGDHLIFVVVNDACAPRVAFFATTTWISTSVSTYAGPRIPEARWARDVTTSQLEAFGFHPDAAWLSANGFTDGRSRFVIEIAGSRWFIFVETNQGGLEIGDQGAIAYDALGRWVQNDTTAVEWVIEGRTLTTRNAVPLEGLRPTPISPESRAVLEGRWQRLA